MGCALCRTCVSKKKRRYQEDPFDLDLTILHKNITVMGYPSSGVEACYRNPYPDVLTFLDATFGEDYLVVNLCSEPDRQYDPTAYFHGRCIRIPFPDHSTCELADIPKFIETALNFINQQKSSGAGTSPTDDNIINTDTDGTMVNKNTARPSGKAPSPSPYGRTLAIHCKAGKGRSGLMACVLLMALVPELSTSAEDAMLFYGKTRTHDGKGLTIPSQRCYVRYYEQLRRMALARGIDGGTNGPAAVIGHVPPMSSIPMISLDGIRVGGGLWPHVRGAEVVRIRIGRYDSTQVIQFSTNPAKAKMDGVVITVGPPSSLPTTPAATGQSGTTDSPSSSSPASSSSHVEAYIDLKGSQFGLLRSLQGDVRIDFLKSGTGKAVWLASLSFHTLFVKPFYPYTEIDKLYKVKDACGPTSGFGLSYRTAGEAAPISSNSNSITAASNDNSNNINKKNQHGVVVIDGKGSSAFDDVAVADEGSAVVLPSPSHSVDGGGAALDRKRRSSSISSTDSLLSDKEQRDSRREAVGQAASASGYVAVTIGDNGAGAGGRPGVSAAGSAAGLIDGDADVELQPVATMTVRTAASAKPRSWGSGKRAGSSLASSVGSLSPPLEPLDDPML